MITSKYSKETIDKARILYETGSSLPEIAKACRVKRVMTIFDWAKKYCWSRVGAPPEVSGALSISASKLDQTFTNIIGLTDDVVNYIRRLLAANEIALPEVIRIMEKLSLLVKVCKTPESVGISSEENTSTSQEKTPQNSKDKVLNFLEYLK